MEFDINNEEQVLQATQAWLENAVIGLNLCPFAKAPWQKQQIRFVYCAATSEESLLQTLQEELQLLAQADPAKIETTVLVHPLILHDFYAYNDFLELADQLLEDLELDGQLQIASFHPAYQFADCHSEAIDNYTNRSPFPSLHLLRESSIDRAVAAFPDAADIYEKNIATMRKLGHAGWQQLDPYRNKKKAP
ncbi:MAG: DUF1415 domain-containing protein [Burkholderiales bacterium]|nr:DUF1415 domain-containing protein [Burkholderiales bacterium]